MEKKYNELLIANKELAFQNQVKYANEVSIANKALVASENRYRRLFEAAQDGILILNVDTGVIEDVNPFMIEMLNYSYSEFLDKELWEIGLFSDINANKEAFIKLKEDGYIRYMDLPLKTKNGHAISVEFVSNRYEVNDGQVIQCNIRNITERKVVEDNNKRLTERLILATQSAKLGIWDWDIKNDVLKWDKGMYLLYDIDEEAFESVHEGWLLRVHPDDIESAIDTMQQALVSKDNYSPIFRIIWKDASVHYIEASAIIERDEQGNAIRMIGANWDITKQTEKERHLKLLESVITNTKDAVMITEAEALNELGPTILYVNEAFTKMTGYSLEEVIGKSPKILQGLKSDSIELKRLNEAMRNWQSCEINIVNYKKNGEEYWVNFSVSPVMNERGCYTHWISIERDITVIKEYINAIENQNIKLREIAWEQSHIVRAPLARMMGIVSVLRDYKQDTAEYNEWVGHFNDSAREFDKIIKDIVDKAQTVLITE